MRQRGPLEDRKRAIVDRWAELALRVYPPESSRIMLRETDRFRNPVGRITRESLDALYDGLVSASPAGELTPHLDGIVRIRAVQDLSPSAAVEFLFLLKRAVREELGGEAGSRRAAPDLSALDSSIDRLALAAFDLFVQCREKICELRVDEVKRNASALLERLHAGPGGAGVESDECGSCRQVKGGCGA